MTCPDDHAHADTSTCYLNHGCRCSACRTGRAEYRYWVRHMRAAGRHEAFSGALIDATGTRRRLQALMSLGWSQRAIAAHADSDQNRISHQLHGDRITRAGAARIAAVYEHLSAHLPPTDTPGQRMSVFRVRAQARRQGWVPPLAWDDIDNDPAPATATREALLVDEVAVANAIAGHLVAPLTTAERHQAVRRLHALHLFDSEIAARCGVNVKTIERDRNALGLHGWAKTVDGGVLERAA